MQRWYRVTLMLSLGILAGYVAFVLWPAYDSGLNWALSNPNRKGEGPFYQAWYEVGIETIAAWLPRPLADVLGFAYWIAIASVFLTAWYALLPLGALSLVLLRRPWPQLPAHERWGGIGLSLLAIVVPLLTWTLSHKFFVWLTD